MEIHLVDSIMGSGKSHWIKNKMVEWSKEGRFEQFVYISPLLSEVGGVEIEDGYEEGAIQRAIPEMQFEFPKRRNGSKMRDAIRLIKEKKNIAATHALFAMVDTPTRCLLKEYKNVLIIDESVSAIEHYTGVSSQGLSNLLKSKELEVAPNSGGRLIWNHRDFPLIDQEDGLTGKNFEYAELMDLCDSGYAYLSNYQEGEDPSKRKNQIILWQYPKELLECFDEVWVLTYLFEGSVMNSWCKMNDISVKRVTPDLHRSTKEVKQKLRDIFILHDTPGLNKVGESHLSQSWWQKADWEKDIKPIRVCLEGMMKNWLNREGVYTDDILITCPKERWFPDDKSVKVKSSCPGDIRGKGYAKATWLASNCKATNEYSDKKCVMYVLNKYPNTFVYNFCVQNGHPLDNDKFALAESLQMIFRCCLRKGERAHIIIVNNRMRKLIKEWLEKDE